jgi:methylated-DNA-[protein]-cysteine S-methyltransferase
MPAQNQDVRFTTIHANSGHRFGLAASEAGLLQVRWLREGETWPDGDAGHPVLRAAIRAIDGYLETGRLRSVPLDLASLPEFRRRVLETLARCVPPGEVITYGDLARLAGYPGAARAVGTAMSQNPLPIFIPCHRVVAAGGPGGFGPGMRVKQGLLAREGYSLAI